MKTAKRILSMLLCLSLFISFITVSPPQAAASGTSSIFSDGVPDEFTKDINPYGYAENQSFMMAPQNELLLLRSHDDGNTKNKWYSGFKVGSVGSNNISSALMHRLDESNSPYKESGNFSSLKSYAFTAAVAFDPFGTGRKDHVAYVGYDHDTVNKDTGKQGRIVVYVMNVNTGATSVAYEVGWAPYLRNNDFEQFEATNLFAITAGRYTDSAKETFVVYVPADDGNYCLKEYGLTANSTQNAISLTCLGESKTYLHMEYRASGNEMAKSNDKNNMLQVSLNTGDFNGDRIDDLAVLSYVCMPEKEFLNVHTKIYCPQLIIARGGGSGTILGRTSGVKDKLVRKGDNSFVGEATDEYSSYLTMMAPSLAVGDVNGDGYDEAIIAGYTKPVMYFKGDDSATILSGMAEGVTVAVFEFNPGDGHIGDLMFKNYNDLKWERPILNKWSQGVTNFFAHMYNTFTTAGGYGEKFYLIPQYAVECVALNGDSNPEYIFMNGSFCTYENGEIVHKYTPSNFLEEEDGGSNDYGFDAHFGFINSTAVGVFDGNEIGREQITISTALLSNEDDDYHYFLGTMGGREYNDTVKDGVTVQYGTVGKYYSTDFCREEYNGTKYHKYEEKNGLFDRGANYYERLNCVVVAIDRGKDGTVARYTDKTYTYSAPSLITVLQAAPYYGSLPPYGDSATTYSFTTEYTIGQQSATSTSFSIGASFETEGPGFKFSLGSGYTESFTQSFESSFTTSHTTTFTAKQHNQVVLQRTPILIYTYQIQDSSGNWKEDRVVQVTVPSKPAYALLTVEEYNTFVDSYQAEFKNNRYSKITSKELLENEGNPAAYAAAWDSGKVKLSAEDYTVTNVTGGITSVYGSSSSNTQSVTSSQGYYLDMFAGTGGDFVVGSAYGGIETSLSGETSRGSFTTKVDHTEVSGTVYGFASVDNSVPDSILSQYGFTWSFGTWNLKLSNGNNTPVYGYVVTSLKTPLAGPKTLTVDTHNVDGEPPLKLTYSAVTNATGYNVYWKNMSGKWELIQTGSALTQYIDYPAAFRGFSMNLVVTATVDGKETAMSPIVTHYKENAALSAYEIAKKNGFVGTEQEWLDSLIGTDGKDGVSITDVSINHITGEMTVTLSTGQTIELGNVVGSNGIDGVGIASVRIDSTTGELIVTMTNGEEVNAGVVTGSDGKDGDTPYIGTNGNWWIGNTDTGVKAGGFEELAAELSSAITNLNTAIANGDTALEEKITALTKAYRDADTAMKAAIANLQDADTAMQASISLLQEQLGSAKDALEAAIQAVQDNLDKAVAELNTAIANGDGALDEKIAALTTAYQDADAILTADVLALQNADTAMQTSITNLQEQLGSVNDTLNTAILAVQGNLDKAVAELNTAIANSDAALEEKITALTKAYRDADAAMNAAIVNLQDADIVMQASIALLQEQLNSAKDALEAAIQAVQNNLDKAVAELNTAIANGDAALETKIDTLTQAYQDADSVLKNDILTLKDADTAMQTSITNLQEQLGSVNDTLNTAILTVQGNLDKAVAELNTAIANGDATLEEKITALTKAYQDADAAMNTAIANLQDADIVMQASISLLQEHLNSAKDALEAAIQAVQDNLDKVVAELNTAIANGDAALEAKIDTLTQAYQDADSVLKNDILTLKATDTTMQTSIASLQEQLTGAAESFKAAIQALQDKLDKAVTDLNTAIANGDSELSKQINALDLAYKAADTLMDLAIDALEAKDVTLEAQINALKASLATTETALTEAIAQVQEALDLARADLSKSVENGDAELSAKLAALDEAYKAADSLMNSDIAARKAENEALQAKLSALEASVEAAHAELNQAIVELQNRLDALENKLNSVDDEKADSTVTYVSISILGFVALAGNAGWIVNLISKKRGL